MTKHAEQLRPNYGPVYAAAMYPELAKIFQKHGYALAVHGSLARDLDLLAFPWVETVSNHSAVFSDVEKTFAVTFIASEGTKKPHGRVAYTMSFGWGECATDVSFVGGQP